MISVYKVLKIGIWKYSWPVIIHRSWYICICRDRVMRGKWLICGTMYEKMRSLSTVLHIYPVLIFSIFYLYLIYVAVIMNNPFSSRNKRIGFSTFHSYALELFRRRRWIFVWFFSSYRAFLRPMIDVSIENLFFDFYKRRPLVNITWFRQNNSVHDAIDGQHTPI